MIEYLTVEQVIELHDELLKRYGGLAGIRDMNLLLSAVEMPKTAMFGQEMYPSIYDKAATYLYHLVCNHPFNDGNKRTGVTAALVFLAAHNCANNFKKEELEKIVLELAETKVDKKELAYFLEHGILKVAESKH